MGIPKGEKIEKGTEVIFKAIMANFFKAIMTKNSPRLGRDNEVRHNERSMRSNGSQIG